MENWNPNSIWQNKIMLKQKICIPDLFTYDNNNNLFL